MFRAYEPDRDRLVAIKLFRLDLPPERVHQLVAEFELLIAAELTRPGIAAPLAAGIDGNVAYLVQEFAAADSLDIVVRDHGSARPADALRIAMQMAVALDFASVVNIDHGALHPRDVLISADEITITGLGVVRALERVGVTTPLRRPYTAPERIAGVRWDHRADIFSLAALVHELLWGRRIAASGAQAADGLTEIAGADLSALRAAFARGLAEDPADRFETALEFAAAVKDAFPATLETRAPDRNRGRIADEPLLLPLHAFEPEPELHPAEPAPYQEIDESPAMTVEPPILLGEPARRVPEPPMRVPEPPMPVHEPPMRPSHAVDADFDRPIPIQPPGFLTPPEPEAISALERSRSAMWPLALAALVGIAVGIGLGFGAGYSIGNRDRTLTAMAPPLVGTSAQTAPAGSEPVTDAASPEPPKPTPSVTSTPPAPVAAPTTGRRPAPDRSASSVGAAGRPPTAAPNASALGSLTVKTTPPGARVFVDGRDRGRTPASIRDLPRGAHRVRLVREGYATEERRVMLNAAHSTQAIAVELARTRQEAPAASRAAPASLAGSLSVDSRPSGARVFVDGKLIGSTPFLLPQIGAGEHAVRIEHDGYQGWSSSVRVVSGERARVTASLEK